MHPLALDPITFTAQTGSLFLCGGEVLVMGWAFKESTGAAVAALDLFNGDPSAGQSILPVNLASNESTRDFVPPAGIGCASDLWLSVTAGSVRGTVYVIPAQRFEDYVFGFAEQLHWARTE